MNAHRAVRGGDVVQFYADEHGLDDEDFRSNAVDVMVDVLHALRARGVDPEAAHAIAWKHLVDEERETVGPEGYP